MKKVILTGLAATVLSANAMAADVTGYTAPQSGQAATAAGVDANFQALITAINDNNQRITALEAASGEVADLADIVSGATYKLYFSGGIIELDDGGGANLERFGGIADLTFNGDGSLSETFSEQGRFISLDANQCSGEGENFSCAHYVETWNDNETGGGAWSVSGQTLNVTWSDGDSESFSLSSDGNVITSGGGGLDEGGGTSGLETFVAVGIRLGSPE
ncbi:hypothetical protein [Alcanivorax sp.]|uniref:hypothetical protein n=1 Tax=Alcanivorax sp. TaxID=1872427 RepID=UPI003A92BA0C